MSLLVNKVQNLLQSLGKGFLSNVEAFGRGSLFMWSLLLAIPSVFFRFDLLLKQIYVAGVLSLPIILMAGLFIGMVLSLQGYTILVKFSAEEACRNDDSTLFIKRNRPGGWRPIVCRSCGVGIDGRNWVNALY